MGGRSSAGKKKLKKDNGKEADVLQRLAGACAWWSFQKSCVNGGRDEEAVTRRSGVLVYCRSRQWSWDLLAKLEGGDLPPTRLSYLPQGALLAYSGWLSLRFRVRFLSPLHFFMRFFSTFFHMVLCKADPRSGGDPGPRSLMNFFIFQPVSA